MTKRYELCFKCGSPTGRAGRGEDSIYDDGDGSGPYCEDCWRDRIEEARALAKALSEAADDVV